MKNFRFIYVLGLAFILAFAGCSDDDDNPTNNNDDDANYFPLTVGSWWTYDYWEIDQDGNQIEGSNGLDSNVVIREETRNGKLCQVIETVDSEETEEMYYYQENNKVYALATMFTPSEEDLFGIPASDLFPDEWVKIADFDASANSEWDVFESSIEDQEVYLEDLGMNVTANLTVTMSAKKLASESVEFMGMTKTAQIFEVSFSITGQMSTLLGSIPLDVPIVLKMYYVDGIGLVRNYMAPTTTSIDVPLAGEQTIDIDGSNSILTNCSIAN